MSAGQQTNHTACPVSFRRSGVGGDGRGRGEVHEIWE